MHIKLVDEKSINPAATKDTTSFYPAPCAFTANESPFKSLALPCRWSVNTITLTGELVLFRIESLLHSLHH